MSPAVKKIELICNWNIIFAKSNQNATQNSYKKVDEILKL
jgi:hypothetical protein